MLEEPCEATSLTHGFEAERRGRLLRLGSVIACVSVLSIVDSSVFSLVALEV